jgi:curved DNA-binding protein
MQFRDYYATLEVPRTATADEIKKSYRRLSKKYHPDANVGSQSSEEKFKELGEAYEVLKDPDKRKRYDRMGSSWNQPDMGANAGGGNPFSGWQNVDWNSSGPGAGGAGGAGFSDFFDTFFAQQQQQQGQRGRRPGARRGREPFDQQAPQPRAGADRDVDLTISLEDALQGVTRSVTIHHPVQGPDGGRRLDEKTLSIKVPPNARDGLKIRVRGEGERGSLGGPPGDLLLTVRFTHHQRFVVDGADLTARLPVTPWEAAFGAKVPFATLDGEVKLTVPGGSSTGTKLRLKGKGLPKKDGERGNLTVEVMVALPTDLGDDDKALLAKWQALRPSWDPRA